MEKVVCNQCEKMFTDVKSLAAHKEAAHPILIGKDFDEKFAKLRDRAMEIQWEFLHSTGDNEELGKLEQSARKVMGDWTRHEATKANRQQTDFLMARSLAQSPEQLADYVRVAMPSAPILKALPSGDARKAS